MRVPSRLLVMCCLAIAGCGASPSSKPTAALHYLGQVQVPHAATFRDTVIGGLSAISYDPKRQVYYVISDDRSAINPARFYTVRLSLSDKGIGDVIFTDVDTLLDESGHPFRPLSQDTSPPTVPPDPEGIAFDWARQRLYWSSEGERITDSPGGPVLLDPWIRIAALEEPGYNDGDPPDRDHGALTRITKFDVDTRAPVAQYAYPLERAPAPDVSNGVSDLVALSDTTFLVVERAGGKHPTVRVFRTEIDGATDVLTVPSMISRPLRPMTKALAVDMSATAGVSPLDNVEGITLGQKLPDGRQSVVFVSDDNFSANQVTQFLLFEM